MITVVCMGSSSQRCLKNWQQWCAKIKQVDISHFNKYHACVCVNSRIFFVILQNPFWNRLAQVLKQQIADGLFDDADDTWTEIMNVISASSNNVVYFFATELSYTFLLSVYIDWLVRVCVSVRIGFHGSDLLECIIFRLENSV